MRNYIYNIVLTNGTTKQSYTVCASCEKHATILAQAEAIGNASGIDFVSIEKIK